MKLIKIPSTGLESQHHYLLYRIYIAAHPTGFIKLTKAKIKYLNDGKRVNYDEIYNDPLLEFKGEWAFFPEYVKNNMGLNLKIGYAPHVPVIKQARLLKWDIRDYGFTVSDRGVMKVAPKKKVVKKPVKKRVTKTAANGIPLPDGFKTWGSIEILKNIEIRKAFVARYSGKGVNVVAVLNKIINWKEANGVTKKNWVSTADNWLMDATGKTSRSWK